MPANRVDNASPRDLGFGPGRRRFLRTVSGAVAVAAMTGGGYAVGRRTGASAVAPSTPPNGLPFAFRTGGYRAALDVPDGMQPWRSRTATRTDKAPHDAAGVRMFPAGGRLYDHPVGQIQFGLANLARPADRGGGLSPARAGSGGPGRAAAA